MNTKSPWIIACLAGLVAGAALDRLVLSGTGSPAAGRAEIGLPAVAPPPVPDHRAEAERHAAMENLRKQVAELERGLQYRMEQIAELQQAVARRDERISVLATSEVPVVARADAGRDRPPREGFEARMERLKTENPGQYAEIQKRREEMQQRLTQLHRDRKTFLNAIDTSRMSEAQRENHAKLLEAIETANDFRLRMSEGAFGQMTGEQRTEAFNAMRAVGELYEQERRFILEETGRSYGEDGAAFADYIENVLENTSMMPGFGRGGRVGRGGPPPPPASPGDAR